MSALFEVGGTTTINVATTLGSSFNIVGNIMGSGTIFTNLNYNAILNSPSTVSFNNPSIFISSLNVSRTTTYSNSLTVVGTCSTTTFSSSGALLNSIPYGAITGVPDFLV